jgi:hypothetical protein
VSVAARLARLTAKDADRIRCPKDRHDLRVQEGLVLGLERIAIDIEVREGSSDTSRRRSAGNDDFSRSRRFQHFTIEHAANPLVNSDTVSTPRFRAYPRVRRHQAR